MFTFLLASATGCSTRQTLRVSNLPRHFVAKKTQNAREVDLSRLASDTTSEDTLVPGDVIEVAIAAGLGADDSTELSTRVGDDGYADLPQIGRVYVAGMQLEGAESVIASQSVQAGVFREPHVTVTMKQPKLIRVTVAGAVEEPGTYELRPGSGNLLNALVVAGSLSDDAGVNVEIRQPGQAAVGGSRAPLVAGGPNGQGHALVGYNPTIPATPASSPQLLKVNLASVARGTGNQYRLRDGAVVFVEQRDPAPISIGGLVNKPDRYEYPVGENLRLLDAVSMAGGESSLVADKIFVIREVDHEGKRQRAVIQASLADAKHDDRENMLLMPGDIVTVEKTPGTVILEAINTVGFGVSGRVF